MVYDAPSPARRISESWPVTALVDKLYRRRDLWIAQTPADRDALFRFRHAVQAEAHGSGTGCTDDGRFILPGDHDPRCIHIGCGPRHAPLATVRVRTWTTETLPGDFATDLALHRFAAGGHLRVSHVDHLMLHGSLRSSLRGLGFVLGAMDLAARAARPDLIVTHAPPGLLGRCQRLGFRTYGAPVFDSDAGPQVPLALVADPVWLRSSASQWAPVLLELLDKGVLRPPPSALCTVFDANDTPRAPARLARAWSTPHALAALPQDAAEAVCRISRSFEVRPGVRLLLRGQGESDLVLLVEGKVRRERAGGFLRHEGPGALLGIEAWLQPGSRHLDTVRTTTPSTILTISGHRLRRLCTDHPAIVAEVAAWLGRAQLPKRVEPVFRTPEVSLV